MPRDSDPRYFPQSSEMAKRLDRFNWKETAIGPPESWPAELHANVNLILDTSIPMMLGWGDDLHVLYNDGYIPIMQEKHPAIWQTAPTLSEELWALAGPLIEGVYHSGEAVKRENMYLPFFRRGFLEECYFTFSYSPIRSRDGSVAGVLSTAIETTDEVLSTRREELLQHIASPQSQIEPDEAIRHACARLEGSPDVPCHLAILSHKTDGRRVISSAGIEFDIAKFGDWLTASNIEQRLDANGIAHITVADVEGIALDEEAATRCNELVIARLGASGASGHSYDSTGYLLLGRSNALPWDPPHEAFIRRIIELIDHHYNAQLLRVLSLEEAENRYRRLFFEALDGILLVRPTGEILAANPAACQLLGYSEAELKATGCALVRDPEDQRWRDFLDPDHPSDAGETFQGELYWLHKSGERVICEVSSSTNPEPLVSSREERNTVILRDVTERLAMQAQLAEAQKMDVVGRVAGGIAHDFNNLLTVIELQTDILWEELQERPELLEDLELLSQAGHRASGLVRRLLEFTRQTREETSAFDSAETLQHLAPLLRRLAGDSIEVTFDFQENLPPLLLSPNRFEQIVMNLIVNARDAIHEGRSGGSISVTLKSSTANDLIALTITDDGIGIPQDKLDRIFDPFYTTKISGSGIGLNTVKMLVEGCGGSIAVSSEPGIQTSFAIHFPTHDKQTANPSPQQRGQAHLRLDGVNVLLVEDQPHLRSLLTRGLERVGATVRAISHGEEATRYALEEMPDILVSDVVMPLRSGPELVRWVRDHAPSLPVVLFSGYSGSEVVRMEELGHVEFLDKPFSIDTLISTIHHALSNIDSGST